MCCQKYFQKTVVGESHVAESKYENGMDSDKLIKHKEVCEQNWKINGKYIGKDIMCNSDPGQISAEYRADLEESPSLSLMLPPPPCNSCLWERYLYISGQKRCRVKRGKGV